jgi:hypothetical protein
MLCAREGGGGGGVVCSNTKGQKLGQIIDRAVPNHVTGQTATEKSMRRQVGATESRLHEVGHKDELGYKCQDEH